MARVVLRGSKGHVLAVWAGHPWVFAQAVLRVEGRAADGDVVEVVDEGGRLLGSGFYSSRSAIAVRTLTRGPADQVDDAFLHAAVSRAVHRRKRLMGLPGPQTTGYRLVHAEGDGLPGLIADRYGDVVTVQFTSLGMKRREQVVLDTLGELLRPRAILETVDEEVQKLEGFESQRLPVRGRWEAPAVFEESGITYAVDPLSAQKTGFYFDQRENRKLLARLVRGQRVLDCCCYVGAFGIACAKAGAIEVDGVDTSLPALAAAQRHAELAHVADRVRFHKSDARPFLEQAQRAKRTWDVVIVDPPKYARRQGDVEKALKGKYLPLNTQALRVVSPGGLLVTCSCSARVRPDHFLRTVGLAAAQAGRSTRVLALRGAGPDHPVPPAFVEGAYLKCVFLEVD
ncbi:MAG: class I SAM-dependent rRNA methyltransferase [Deltaproteobacteria bacterium]|nr:class I SAM-dependent rRNA methyltransferase [Deltaproteobacteria bacterium]